MAVPQLDEFLGQARELNPGVSDSDLTDYWKKTYAPKVEMPSMQSFMEKAREVNKGVADADLQSYWQEKYGAFGAPEKEPTTSPTDYLKSLAGGAASGLGAIAQGGGEAVARGINAVAGTDLRAVNPLQGAIDWLNESQTPAAKKAVANTQIEGDLSDMSTWSAGKDPSFKGLALQGLNAIGQFAPNLAIALGTAGMSVPAQVAIGATVGGLQALGAGSQEERDRFGKMTPEELGASSSLYRELIGRGVKPTEAKLAVMDAAALGGGLGNAIPSAGEGAFENFMVGALTKGRIRIPAMFGTGVAGKAATGILGGMMTGGTEEAGEQAAQNFGSNLAVGGNRPIGEGTLQQFVMGMIAEGTAGGGGAIAQHAFLPAAPKPTTDDILKADTVEDAIKTAQEALRGIPYTPPDVTAMKAENLALAGPQGPVGNEIEYAPPSPLDRAAAVEQAQTEETARQADAARQVEYTPQSVPLSQAENLTTGEAPQPAGNEIDIQPFLRDRAEGKARAVEEMTDRELALASNLTRSEERKAELQSEIQRRVIPAEAPASTTENILQPSTVEDTNARALEGQPAPREGVRDVAAEAAVPVGTGVQAAEAPVEAPRAETLAAAAQEKPQVEVQDYQHRNKDGVLEVKKFATKKLAEVYKKSNGIAQNYSARKEGSKWLLSRPYRERTAGQLANDERLRREKAAPSVLAHDSAATVIAKAGGINANELLRDGEDMESIRSLRSGVVGKPAYRVTGGMSMDAAAEVLDSHGFDVRDEDGSIDATKAREILASEINGEPVYSHEGQVIRASREAELREKYRANEEEIAAVQADSQAAEDAALAAEAVDLDPDRFERLAVQFENDHAGFMRGIRELIHDQSAKDRQAGPADTRQEERTEASARPEHAEDQVDGLSQRDSEGEDASGRDQGAPPTGAVPPPLQVTAQTPAPAGVSASGTDYTQYAGKTVRLTLPVEGGKTATMTMKADEALKDIDERIAAVEELRACL